ncbi:hypothetical protein PF011_g18771 [Phytophthora fragariae]|uniref:Uncharacterized protein n=1 Tax=Phytophthora fragariae TaxID=53985 RepID=A0A6A3JCV9_9STRA|nr:hypothetical protein PF011_g18771 [Phytophthora fragariae]
MPPTPLQIGAYLLLRPEDVQGTAPRAFYAAVTSASRAKVKVSPLPIGLSDDTIEIPRPIAEDRVVPRGEATGHQSRTWLRAAVWVTSGSTYRYGQVRGYSGNKLHIWTAQGELTVTRRQIVAEVQPIIALALGSETWNKRAWPKSRLLALHSSLTEKITALGDSNASLPTVTEWLDELKAHTAIEHLVDAQVEWVDPASGNIKAFSLLHALRFVIFKANDGHPPPDLLQHLGNSLVDEPQGFRPWINQARTQSDGEYIQHPALTARAFLSSLSDGEESDRDDPPLVRSRPLPQAQAEPAPSGIGRHDHTTQRSANTAPPSSPPGNSVLDGTAEVELIELLRDLRPDLLQLYLRRTTEHGSARLEATRHARPAVVDNNPAPLKRRKRGFYPSADQERVHQVVTSDAHRGKDGEDFMEFLTTSSLPLDFHPGMLNRAYDVGFGSKGLSIRHFGRVGYLDRLRKVASANVDTTDFTLPVPPAPTMTSWVQLHDATSGFLQYCTHVCEPITIQVATSLAKFVLHLQVWNHWLPDELPNLVLWINATLEPYRNAAAQDDTSGLTTRAAALDWFATSNPDLQALLFTTMSERSCN